MNALQAPIRKVLSRHEQIKLCIIFGSVASGKESSDSDLDLAIAGDQPLSAADLLELAEEFSTAANRNVDLVDLAAATGLISQQALSTGVILQNNDKDLYARLISRMLFNQADMMPYHDRILRERRRQFLNE
jgi:predicted nucleotidyltransferase